MGALSIEYRSLPVSMSICSEIFEMAEQKNVRLDKTAEKRKTV